MIIQSFWFKDVPSDENSLCTEYVKKADHLAAMKKKEEWYLEQWGYREAERDKKEVELKEQITALTIENKGLRDREEILIRRLQTHGDIETDKEEAIRGGGAG